MPSLVYCCGARTALTALTPPSPDSQMAAATPTPEGPGSPPQRSGSTGFESPSPIAQDPSLHSSWQVAALPPQRRSFSSTFAVTVSAAVGVASRSASRPCGAPRGKCVSPLLSPSLNAGSSGELTQENVTASTRGQATPQGASLSQEGVDPSGNATVLAGPVQAARGGTHRRGSEEGTAERSDPLQCSSIHVVMPSDASRDSAESPAAKANTMGESEADVRTPVMSDIVEENTPEYDENKEERWDNASRSGASTSSADACPDGEKPRPTPTNSREARALFLGDVTPLSRTSSSAASAAATALSPLASHPMNISPTHERRATDEQTPIKQSLSQLRAATAAAAKGEEGVAQSHPYRRAMAAVAFTPDSVRKAWVVRQKAATTMLSAKRLPSEEAAAGGGGCPAWADEEGEEEDHSPQHLPSSLATPNLCTIEGFSPDSAGGARRSRSRPRASLEGAAGFPFDLDDPEGTPVGRFSGFPSPVKLSPIPTKASRADLFFAEQAAAQTRAVRVTGESPWQRRAIAAEGVSPVLASEEEEDRRLQEHGFRPEYISSSTSQSTSSMGSCRGDGCGGFRRENDSVKSVTCAYLPKAPASGTPSCCSSSCPTSPLVDGSGQGTGGTRRSRGGAAAASVSHVLNSTDTTQPPRGGSSEQTGLETADRSKEASVSGGETHDETPLQNSSHSVNTHIAGSRQLSSLRNATDLVSMTESLPTWAALATRSSFTGGVAEEGKGEDSAANLEAPGKRMNELERGSSSIHPATPAVPAIMVTLPGQVCLGAGSLLGSHLQDEEVRQDRTAATTRRSQPGEPILSPSPEISPVRGSRETCLCFSALPIPGILRTTKGVAARSRGGAAVRGPRWNTEELPEQSMSPPESDVGSSSPNPVGDVEEASSPSRLFVDYYYSSSHAKKPRRGFLCEKHPVSPTHTDLSLSVPHLPIGRGNGSRRTDAVVCTDVLPVPPSCSSRVSTAASTTVFETVSTIKSRNATQAAPPRDTVALPRRTSSSLSSPSPAADAAATTPQIAISSADRQAWRRERDARRREKTKHLGGDPAFARATGAILKTEMRAAVHQTHRRFDAAVLGTKGSVLGGQTSHRFSLDSFL